MKNDKIITLLEELGLSEKEAKVYLAALSLGPATILKIARTAETRRTTVYSLIDSLKTKGLMAVELKGFKTLYAAEDPKKLETVLEQRRQKLKDNLPDLSAMFNLKGGESYIKYYEGVESIKSIYRGLLEDIRPHEDYLIFSNVDEWWKLDREFLLKFTLDRAELARTHGIKIKILLQNTPGATDYKKNEKLYCLEAKKLPANNRLTTNLVIIPKKVVIHQLTPPAMAIVIENKSIIQLHRELFETIWQSIPT